MLSITDILALAQQHPLDLTAHWPETTRGGEPPKPTRLTVYFREDAPEA